jgi:quinol monooxygenase YgiN
MRLRAAPAGIGTPTRVGYHACEEGTCVIAFVWRFEIKPGRQEAFERFYGADGEWTALSRRSRSYLGSSFLRDLAQPTRYLVVEYWSEMVIYERHTANFRDEIARLERERELLLESSSPAGIFNALDVPDRAGPTWSRRSGLR